MKRRKNKSNKIGLGFIIVCSVAAIILLTLLFVVTRRSEQEPKVTEAQTQITEIVTTVAPETEPPKKEDDSWKLVLVNRWNSLPEGFTVNTVEYSEGRFLDSRIIPELDEMFAAAAADGIILTVRSAYRTAEEQQELYEQKRQSLLEAGMSEADVDFEALQWVAYPGTSEHQTGLALDVNGDGVATSNEDGYNWLLQNAYKYGFINRYSDTKSEITGVANEPWHIRYVGREAASEIFNGGLCLEEYLGRAEH